jgi:hypothetical protein
MKKYWASRRKRQPEQPKRATARPRD